MITGKTLVEWGFTPGPWFATAIQDANALAAAGMTEAAIISNLREHETITPPEIPYRTNSIPFEVFLKPDSDVERANLTAVEQHMDVLMRVPTLRHGAVMPDACPSGSQPGTIPVGGVVAAEDAIHPGFHSADICCSMAISVFKRDMAVSDVLDVAMKTTHFGFGLNENLDGRKMAREMLAADLAEFERNPFLRDLERFAVDLFMTQGDGNHFLYVGYLESTGQLALVTHHGSRGLGAQLYKRGMNAARRHTAIVAPRVPSHNAWIKADSQQGVHYWEALQLVRRWTKANHMALHTEMGKRMGNAIVDQWWNEHNFVFQKSDGLFYHAKGATPAFNGFSDDDSGQTLIPLNMAEPILITRPSKAANLLALGFAPHGAGRNLSRTAHIKSLHAEFGADARGLSLRDQLAIVEREVASRGIDARFYCGRIDVSELPSAYKNATAVRAQIDKYALAEVVDTVVPGGAIMAGDFAPVWRKKRKK